MGHTLSEFRCSCGKLLAKGNLVIGVVEIKCKRCGTVQRLHATQPEVVDPQGFAFLCDVQGNIVSASKNVSSTLGYSMTELLRTSIDEISTRESDTTTLSFPMLLRDAPQDVSEKIVYTTRSGDSLPALTRCIRVVGSPDGQPLLLMVAHTQGAL